MLAFSEESFPAALPDFKRLAHLHWGETEMYRHGQAFSPDWARYQDYNTRGFYHFFVARDEGRAVGNAGMYVMPCMHTQRAVATEDTWFLEQAFRKGRNAILFHKYIEAEMRKLGVITITMDAKLTNGAGRIMEYLGYKHVANRYTKEI